MKIHGSTDIILKTKYGRVDRYHSENTFQSGILAEGLRNLGYAKASMYNSPDASNPPFSEIVGGILLLDKNDIPVNSQFVPLGVKMTGNGAFGVTNSSAPNELGSYNSAESIITPSSITQVYDWTTSQANGVIGSVCLTSRKGGYIGMGNSISGQYASTLYDVEPSGIADACPQDNLGVYKQNYNKIVCNGKQYSFVLNGTNLEITSFKIPLKNASVFDCIPTTIIKSVSDKQYSWMGGNLEVSASEGKIYLTPRDTMKPSGSFFIWKFDTSDESLTELEFNFGVKSMNVSVSHEKIFVPVYEGHTFKVFSLDGTSYDEIETGTIAYADWIGSNVGDFGNHSLVRHIDYGSQNQYWSLYDSQLRTAYPTNMKANGFNRTQGLRMEETSKALIETYWASGTSSLATHAFNNPLYLATINNLNEPVTKNLTMAMKVLYKLEQV